MNDQNKINLFNELKILQKLDHPNALRIYESFEDEKRYYIVTELCAGGTLFDELKTKEKFSEREASLLLKEVLTCLNYCHKNNIVHRDLNTKNLLLE